MKVTKTNEMKKALENSRFIIREEFECGKYSVIRDTIKYLDENYTYVNIRVSNKDERFVPTIFYEDWSGFDVEEKGYFTIQTTAYGSLKPEEIVKVVNGYNEALEVVEALTKYFC